MAIGFIIGLVIFIYLYIADDIKGLFRNGPSVDPEKERLGPDKLYFLPNTTEEEKERIEKEKHFRYLWANLFYTNNINYIHKSLLKYHHPDKEVEVALNMEYAMGYKGYYNHRFRSEESVLDVLREVERCRDNPKYFTPSYYYNYCDDISNSVISLLGEEMTLKEFNAKLISMQYLPKFEASENIYRDNYPLWVNQNFNIFPKYAQDKKIEEFVGWNRFDTRNWEYCTVELDAKNAMIGTPTPLCFFPENGVIDRYTSKEREDPRYNIYREKRRTLIEIELFGNQEVYEGKKLPDDTMVRVLGIKLPEIQDLIYDYDVRYLSWKNKYHAPTIETEKRYELFESKLLTKDSFATKKEIEDYRVKLRERAKRFEKRYQSISKSNLLKYDICTYCGEMLYNPTHHTDLRFVCKKCREKHHYYDGLKL